jgi:hypothetical protein
MKCPRVPLVVLLEMIRLEVSTATELIILSATLRLVIRSSS